MSNAEGTIWIVFNGEIYNYRELGSRLRSAGYRFRSQSDTEVVLYLYEERGERCVEELDGMFAFAIWDERRQRLFLARDRPGKKPLFYYKDARLFAFASEIKALLRYPLIPLELNTKAFPAFFLHGYVPTPETLYKNIYKLPPGHTISTLSQLLYLNFKTYLLDDLLVKMDRSTMANSLEARSPFLDTALAEYAASLPDRMKLRWGRTKYILKKAFADLLPKEILHRGKMGFGVPLGVWFRGELREYVQDLLCSPQAFLRDYVHSWSLSVPGLQKSGAANWVPTQRLVPRPQKRQERMVSSSGRSPFPASRMT
jgi:asparagine synthetase B (glutamine-hydrolysing)